MPNSLQYVHQSPKNIQHTTNYSFRNVLLKTYLMIKGYIYRYIYIITNIVPGNAEWSNTITIRHLYGYCKWKRSTLTYFYWHLHALTFFFLSFQGVDTKWGLVSFRHELHSSPILFKEDRRGTELKNTHLNSFTVSVVNFQSFCHGR